MRIVNIHLETEDGGHVILEQKEGRIIISKVTPGPTTVDEVATSPPWWAMSYLEQCDWSRKAFELVGEHLATEQLPMARRIFATLMTPMEEGA